MFFFFSLFIFRGHSTREPASSRVTYFILRAYTGTGVSNSQHRKKIGRDFGKNASEWIGSVASMTLYSLLQALKGERLSSVFSSNGTLISASADPHCGASRRTIPPASDYFLQFFVGNFLVGPQEPLLTTVKSRKLAEFGHITCHNSLSKTTLQGTLEGGRRHGRQKQCWMDKVKEWTSLLMPELLTTAFCRKDWKGISAESSVMFPRRPNRSRD